MIPEESTQESSTAAIKRLTVDELEYCRKLLVEIMSCKDPFELDDHISRRVSDYGTYAIKLMASFSEKYGHLCKNVYEENLLYMLIIEKLNTYFEQQKAFSNPDDDSFILNLCSEFNLNRRNVLPMLKNIVDIICSFESLDDFIRIIIQFDRAINKGQLEAENAMEFLRAVSNFVDQQSLKVPPPASSMFETATVVAKKADSETPASAPLAP